MALRLYDPHLDKIEPAVRAEWVAVSEMLRSPEVERAIRSKLREGLETRARGDKVAGPDALRLVAKPVLYSDKDGYQIKPHPDTRKKVVTMQLYCPTDNSQQDLGTTLYQASLKGLLHVGSYFLEPVKTLPFLPNVGYAFAVLKAYHTLTGMSWHGRPKITAPVERPRSLDPQHILCRRAVRVLRPTGKHTSKRSRVVLNASAHPSLHASTEVLAGEPTPPAFPR